MPLHHLLGWSIAISAVILSVVTSGHALLHKRDPRAAFTWIMVIALPFAGPLIYWVLGINRITRKAQSWKMSGRRPDLANSRSRIDGGVRTLSSGMAHLRELRKLSDHVVSSPLLAGNSITPLENGEEAYPAMLEAIAGASHSINLSTYIFDSDRAGRWFIRALRSAAARGVEVRIIIDSLGEKYSFPVARHYLKKSKVKIGRFLPLRRGGYVNLRNHRKILIVDGIVAFTGGMNIGDRHLVERTSGPPPVRDLHFRLHGPVVAELQKVFLEDWFFVTSELLDNGHFFPRLSHVGTTLARVIADGPDKPFRNLEWIIMGALSSARERIDIMTPYFIPDRAMISAITTAALRGVAVRIVLPAHNNLPLVHWATRAYLWEFLQHGVQIYYQPPPFVHSKLFLVDNHWSLIGSANLDPRSLRLNFEVNLEIYDRDFCSRLGSRFASTIGHSRPVTMEEMDSRPLTEKLRDAAAKLFSPYL